jgi:hypothetical protein
MPVRQVAAECAVAIDRGAARRAAADQAGAARIGVEGCKNPGAILFECTNMRPFSRDVAEVSGLPLFDKAGAEARTGRRATGGPARDELSRVQNKAALKACP